MNKFFVFLLILFLSKDLLSQDINQQAIIENIVEQQDESFNLNTFLEQIDYLKDHPIDLNKIPYSELLSSGLLTSKQTYDFITHRQQYGRLYSINELFILESFDSITIEKIKPYVFVGHSTKNKKLSTLFLRTSEITQKKQGYTDTSYLGNPLNIYARYRFQSNKINVGFTLEKDAGELLFKNNFPDFYSAHIFFNNIGKFKSIAIGDYSLNFGQGLTVWNGFGFGKSPDVTNIIKYSKGLKPYTSSAENTFFRGFAFTYQIKNFEITPFFSKNTIDANISEKDSLNNKVLAVSSIQQSGYHRTENEIEDKNALGINSYGTNISFSKNALQAGLTFIRNDFNANINPIMQTYKRYNFSGDHLSNIAFDYNYAWQDIEIFGEIAVSDNGKTAVVNGIVAYLSSKVKTSILYRNYNKAYHSMFANAFADGSSVANETGLYSSISINPNNKWRINSYIDFYMHPWLKFQTDAPSKGIEYFTQIDYLLNKTTTMFLRYKTKNYETNSSIENNVELLQTVSKKNCRYQIIFNPSSVIKLNSRVDYNLYSDEIKSYSGYWFSQDVVYAFPKKRIVFTGRIALFETEDYHTRIYTYEPDVLYDFSIPSFDGSGMRYVVMLKYSPVKKVDLWFRYALTSYSDRSMIGTGNEMISGNIKSEIKLQARMQL